MNEFLFHEQARRNEGFSKYVQFIGRPWFQKFAGSIFHVLDSHSDERTGYLQWSAEEGSNECCPPRSVSALINDTFDCH